MNVVGSKNSKNVVSLQELVPQHDCLKLLILHTPYTLVIDTLNLCVNLVKLDLSKNNLQAFPHLGNLTSLKFMFIHENRLDIAALRGIFQLNGKKSALSQNIVWVTFWGNRNAFIGRHYLANQTSAIAIDRNMLVQQQKTADFPFTSPQPFSQHTDISIFFQKKGSANRFASQEEYMRELWLEMRELRKLNEQLFPIIKIQKVFRGWIQREKAFRFNRQKKESNQVMRQCFKAWLQHSRRQAKLKRILKSKGKEHLLLQLIEMRKQQKINKMILLAREIRQRVFTRKNNLKNQIRFYHIVRQNYLVMKSLYRSLGVAQSKAVYIHKSQWDCFMEYVMPFLKLMNPEPAVPRSNERFCLHMLYQFFSASKQSIKVLQTSTKSMAYFNPKDQSKKQRKPYLYGSPLKAVYGAVHISTPKQMHINDAIERIDAKRMIALEELIRFEGSQLLLRDIVRGVYFYNTGRLNGGSSPENNERINVFTEFSLKKIASVTKIQKVWRGYSYRKKKEVHLKVLLKFQRAAIIIQRWVRKLPTYRKKNFIYDTSKQLESIKESTFYVQTSDYFSFLKEKQTAPLGFKFCELDSKVYIHSQSNTLSLCWNSDSQQLQAMTNIRMKKWMFSKPFLKNKLGLTDEQIMVKMVYDSSKHLPSTFSHIFHFGTTSSIVSKGKKSYLQVTCPSRSQAKFRVFLLLVCSYQMDKKNRLVIIDSKSFRQKELAGKREIGRQQVNFICNQNFGLIKLCEQKFQNEPKVRMHIITNRFYFQGEERPLKAEEKFFIYTYNNSQQPQVEQIEKQEPLQRYRTEEAEKRPDVRLLTENIFESQGLANKESEASGKIRILIKKRSVKQYKIDKRDKRKKDHPNFLLDSLSINDRLTTQPDAILTQISNQQNSAFEHNQDPAFLERNQQRETLKAKQRMTYIDKRNNSFKRKQDENFTKRFVNLGNFIQNQYANDYRRRIKTQLQNRAADSAQHVRREIARSLSQKVQESEEKQKKIREKHKQHKQLVEKTQSLMRDHSLQMKNGIIETRQRKLKERAKLKRLKVSFAEECYPLASKHRKQEYFP